MQLPPRSEAEPTGNASPGQEQVLGIRFFNGPVDSVVRQMCQRGGLLVAPSGTCFSRLQRDASYRQAMSTADRALADSGLMVLLWRIIRGRRVTRISEANYREANRGYRVPILLTI